MYQPLHFVQFPKPRAMSVNMMPFIMGDPATIPEDLHGYLPLIAMCDSILPGKVAYLTVTEGRVPGGTTQRRGGVHTEAGNGSFWSAFGSGFTFGGGSIGRFGGGTSILEELAELRRVSKEDLTYDQRQRLEYLQGILQDGHCDRKDGVYMASTNGACRVWDSTTTDVDALGALKKEPLGVASKMEPSKLYWMTDRTPHEALPSVFSEDRQFFRVVSNKLGGWWEKHCTPNPLGILPDCMVLKGSKFSI